MKDLFWLRVLKVFLPNSAVLSMTGWDMVVSSPDGSWKEQGGERGRIQRPKDLTSSHLTA